MLPLADALDVTERIGYIWPPARRLQHFNKNQGKRGLIKLRNFQESKRRPVCKCRGLGEKHAKVLPPRGIFKLQSIVSVWLFQVSRNRNRPTWRLEGKKSENQFEFRSNSRLHFFCLSSSSEPTSSKEFEREVASNSNGSQLRPEHTAPTRSTKRSSSHRPTVGPRF